MFDLIGPALGLAGSLLGGKSKTKPYTVDNTPYWLKEFPEYKQGYQQVLADYMNNIYNKPYQPSYHMRRAGAEDSPYLQQIQGNVDTQINNPQAPTEESAPQQPRMDIAAMKAAADAQIGREMYSRSNSDPMFGYGRRGGRLGFQQMLTPDSSDDEYALAARMWNLPGSQRAALHREGAVKASEVAKNVMAGLNSGNISNQYGSNIAQRLQGLGGSI